MLLMMVLAACNWALLPSSAEGVAPPAEGDPPPAEGDAPAAERYYATWLHSDYDALAYDLTIAVDPAAQTIAATAQITAQALAPLAQIGLELQDLTVEEVTVDGQPATFARSGRTLQITPAQSLAAGAQFVVVVRYSGAPAGFVSVVDAQNPVTIGWVNYRGGSCVIGEPDGAAAWFPSNNYPTDKARYTLQMSVPQPYTIAAAGAEVISDDGTTTTYRWAAPTPAASYLVSPCVGEFERAELPGATDVPLPAFFPAGLRAAAEPELAQTGAMLAFFEERYGPYPFDSYTSIVIDVSDAADGSVEAQMRSLLGLETQGGVILFRDAALNENIVAHELAHQWFGNSVSLNDWGDLWLKEGLASYNEWLWEEQIHGSGVLEARVAPEAYRAFQARTRGYLPGRPPADNLYNGAIYERSQMLFHALRLEVGDEAFFAALRAFADRYHHGNAGRAEFIQVVTDLSQRDLTSFFDQWLYAEEAPDLPTSHSRALSTYLPISSTYEAYSHGNGYANDQCRDRCVQRRE